MLDTHQRNAVETVIGTMDEALRKETYLFAIRISHPLLHPYLNGTLSVSDEDQLWYAVDMAGFGMVLPNITVDYASPDVTIDSTKIPNVPMSANPKEWIDFMNPLSHASTMRVAEFFRLTHNFSAIHEQTRQLSLGAGQGLDEIHGIFSKNKVLKGNNRATFTSNKYSAKRIILVDNDPEKWTKKRKIHTGSTVSSITSDAIASLDPQIIQNKQTLVTMLRMDPRVFSHGDEYDLFSRLRTIIEPQADFIVTIGCGNSQEEYDARVHWIHKIEQYLKAHNHDTLLADFTHGKGRAFARWGALGLTHHMALHAKLNPELL